MLDDLVMIRKVIDHFQLKELCLMGHSWGGALLGMFAAVFPDMVKGLVVIDMRKT